MILKFKDFISGMNEKKCDRDSCPGNFMPDVPDFDPNSYISPDNKEDNHKEKVEKEVMEAPQGDSRRRRRRAVRVSSDAPTQPVAQPSVQRLDEERPEAQRDSAPRNGGGRRRRVSRKPQRG